MKDLRRGNKQQYDDIFHFALSMPISSLIGTTMMFFRLFTSIFHDKAETSDSLKAP